GGRHPVYLVTSVLDRRALTDRQVVEVYARRWGVELFYRHFKQTYERRKLRSHTADHAELEATWSLLGLWALGLHAQVELARAGVRRTGSAWRGCWWPTGGRCASTRATPTPGSPWPSWSAVR